MAKFFTEKTLRNIQIMHVDTIRHRERLLWIELACNISISFDMYCQMKVTAKTLKKSDDDMTIDEWEEFLTFTNELWGTEYGLSNLYVDPDKNADEAIIYYNCYKNIMKTLESRIFKASVAEKLFEEMYNDMHGFNVPMIMNHYYSQIALQVLSYMCKRKDYKTFKQNVLAIKIIPNQRPLDGAMLKEMLKAGMEFVSRYLEILRAQKAEG